MSEQSEVYRTFHDGDNARLLISLFGIKVAIALVGIFLGANLVLVTHRRKSLHTNCNVLLALYAACTCFQQANFFVPFACALRGRPYIPYGQCFLLQMVPIFCAFTAFPLTFCISLERFLAVCFPLWYKRRPKRHCLAPMLALCCALGAYVFAQDARTALQQPTQEVICAVGPKVDASFFTLLILAMNIASVALYIGIWARVKLTTAAISQFTDVQKRVLQCLFVLLLLELFGWALSVLLRLTLQPVFGVPPTSLRSFLIINLATNLAYIAMALTVPVLFMFSTEHRLALRWQLGLWKALLCGGGGARNTVSTSIVQYADTTVAAGQQRRQQPAAPPNMTNVVTTQWHSSSSTNPPGEILR